MAIDEHLELARKGEEAIKAWRKSNPDVRLDLSEADLCDAELTDANLCAPNLRRATNVDLTGAAGYVLPSTNVPTWNIPPARLLPHLWGAGWKPWRWSWDYSDPWSTVNRADQTHVERQRTVGCAQDPI